MTKELKEIRFKNWWELNKTIFKTLFTSNKLYEHIWNNELKEFINYYEWYTLIIEEESELDLWKNFFLPDLLENKYNNASWVTEEILKNLNLVFKWKVHFSNVKNEMIIKNIIFSDEVILKNSNNIFFENCNFKKDYKLDNTRNYWIINFYHCEFKNIQLLNFKTNWIYFNDTKFKKLEIRNIEINNTIDISNTKEKIPYYLSIKSSIKNWDIFIDWIKNLVNLHIWKNEKRWTLWKIEIHNINFLSWDWKNSYIINDIDIKNLVIKYSTNFSKKLIFQNLILNELSIINTDLWETTFNWVEITKLYLENTNLNNCIFNWVDFPNEYKLEQKKLKNKKMKDNYRQLKFVMDKNWNHTEANKFYWLEMEYYMKIKSTSNYEKFILFSSYLLNNFWNSWILPSFWILSLAYFSTFIYSTINWNYILVTFIKQFLYLLYPLYWIDWKVIINLEVKILLWFTLYKILYIIILWHLWVALKRTTKR